jgi:hypothetical protein
MSGILQGILIALVPALVVSIITAYVTVRLSLRQFYSQRWWERKAETYSSIIEHLSYLYYYLAEWEAENLNERKLGPGTKRELSEGYRKSRESLTKAAAIGSYIVSDNAANSLKELLRELNKYDPEGNLGADIERHYTAVEKCIAKIREEAKFSLLNR